MFKYITILFVTFCVTGCGPAAKLRKAERLINKAEELGATWHVDTVKVDVPVYVPQTLIKEVHHAPRFDTITVEKERLRVKVVKMPGDSIFIEGECEADTIYQKVPVTVTKTIDAKGGIRWWWLIVAALAGAGLIALFRR